MPTVMSLQNQRLRSPGTVLPTAMILPFLSSSLSSSRMLLIAIDTLIYIHRFPFLSHRFYFSLSTALQVAYGRAGCRV